MKVKIGDRVYTFMDNMSNWNIRLRCIKHHTAGGTIVTSKFTPSDVCIKFEVVISQLLQELAK